VRPRRGAFSVLIPGSKQTLCVDWQPSKPAPWRRQAGALRWLGWVALFRLCGGLQAISVTKGLGSEGWRVALVRRRVEDGLGLFAAGYRALSPAPVPGQALARSLILDRGFSQVLEPFWCRPWPVRGADLGWVGVPWAPGFMGRAPVLNGGVEIPGRRRWLNQTASNGMPPQQDRPPRCLGRSSRMPSRPREP